jgi:hypothetical protein
MTDSALLLEIDSSHRDATLKALNAHDVDRAVPVEDRKDIADWRDELRTELASDLGIHDAVHGVNAIFAGACVFNGWALHKMLTREEFKAGFEKFATMPMQSSHTPSTEVQPKS